MADVDPNELAQEVLCQKLVSKYLKQSPMVLFLLQALNKSGCHPDKVQIKCSPCKEGAEGGSYDQTSKTIKICQNWIQTSGQVEDVLSHELIHAYDDCRVKDFSERNCKHVACSEIRAANLSGECKFGREILRGNLSPGQIAGAFNSCVRRRARLSMLHNTKACAGCDVDKILDDVFEACLADTAPFIEIP